MSLRDIKIEDHFTIETHFGVPENFIRADTRNKCSGDLVSIIQEIAEILYPDDLFEVYLLPSESGSYRDIVKFVKKHKVGTTVGTVIAIGTLTLGFLNYKDSHTKHLNDEKDRVIDETTKCLELQKMIEELGERYVVDNIPERKLKEVCGNLNLKKRKNSFYNTLQNDSMVVSNETVLKNDKNTTVLARAVERTNFNDYIEPIPDQQYSKENAEGVIEIISPVVRQKKEGKGIAWRGTYCGEDIYYDDIPILKDEEDIDFYMQDPDFKTQINNKEVAFSVGDNMRITFDVMGELKGWILQNRAIYIKEVKNYNEEVIFHKPKIVRKNNDVLDNQSKLFEI